MGKKKTSKLTRIVAGFMLALVCMTIWSLFFTHVDEPLEPLSVAEATKLTGVAIPPEATNIRFASYSQWIQHEEYLRFDAPVAACLRVAAAVSNNEPLRPADKYQVQIPMPVRPNVFKKFTWFDLDQATDIVGAGGGPGIPEVWVDQRRGVFFLPADGLKNILSYSSQSTFPVSIL